jgi:hypothetical protein
MKQVSFFYFVLMLGIVIIGCKTPNNPIGDNGDILGCMESSACNYDSKANIPNDSCVFTRDCNGECGGIAELDVCGVCGGNIESEENCPECQYALGCDGVCLEFPIILDECGVCGGEGIDEGACDCDGNVDLGCGCGEAGLSGCDNACGSTLEFDECSECGGDGSSCATSTINILYNTTTDIGGFQFNVDGATVTGASGGAAEAAGFMISTGNNTVLAFSLTGAAIPAGSGVLIQVEIVGDANAACLSAVVLSDPSGIGLYVEFICDTISE